jgi:hypothetical protein
VTWKPIQKKENDSDVRLRSFAPTKNVAAQDDSGAGNMAGNQAAGRDETPGMT